MRTRSSAAAEKQAQTPQKGPAREAVTPENEAALKSVSTSEVVGAAITGGASLMLLQTVQRAANFVLNQLLLRHVAPEVFGMASVPLDLLLNTALFLAREGVRLCLAREVLVNVPSGSRAFRHFVNLAWAPVLLVPLLSMASLPLLPTGGGLREAGWLFCLSAVVEGLSEPAYLLCMGALASHMRAMAEGVGLLLKSAVTYVLLVHVLPPQHALQAFALAQVCYSCMLLLVYWGYVLLSHRRTTAHLASTKTETSSPHTETSGTNPSPLFPSPAPAPPLRLLSLSHLLPGPFPTASSERDKQGQRWVEGRQVWLAVAMSGQGLLKHLLTQGDKIMLSLAQNYYDQGLYALAHNYGSLAARLLFQPLEEAARLIFSRLARKDDESRDVAPQGDEDRDVGKDQNPSSSSSSSSRPSLLLLLLRSLVKLVLLVGLVFSCLGFNYTRLLLSLLLGRGKKGGGKEGWGGEAAWLLSCYCVYVSALALNGMTEAFVYAVATHKQVSRSLSLSTGLSFLAFALLALPLMRHYGSAGLVAANTAAMGLRVAYSLHFTTHYFAALPSSPPFRLHALLPHPLVLSAFALAFGATRASDLRTPDVTALGPVLVHVGVGLLCALLVVVSVGWKEREWIRDLATIRRIARGGPVEQENLDKTSGTVGSTADGALSSEGKKHQ